MPNHAIVIGISEYRDANRFGPLDHPVGDAIRMAEWLLDPANAFGVAEENLILLLAPEDAAGGAADPLKRLATLGNRRLAEFDQINKSVRDIHALAGDGGGRLYFYYSGHGLSAALDALGNDVEDAIVPSDYDPAVPKPAISIPSITRTLLATSCREQFFFLDCCRNQLQREEIAKVGRLSPNRRRPSTDQYIYSATAMGLKAAEGDGLFSDILLRGLAGEGSAKAFSRESGQYEVRAERLFQYLRKGFEALKRQPFVDGGDGVEARPQRPRLGGEHGGDPVLKTLDSARDVSLRIAFETPAIVAAGSKIAEARVFGDGLPPEPPREATAGAAVDFSLPPRLYFVRVVPEPGLSGPPPTALEVYDDPTDHAVKLATTSGSAAVVAPSRRIRGIMAAPTRVSIAIDDPLMPIELLDSAGAPARDAAGAPMVGIGRVEGTGLPPGLYRARSRTPEGGEVEAAFTLGPGGDESIRLRSPSAAPYAPARPRRGADDMAEGIRLVIAGEVVPAPGRVVNPALAARPRAPEGVAGYLDELEARVWPLDDEPGAPRSLNRNGAAASLSWPLPPGPYRLSIGGPIHGTTTFELVALPGLATDLVIRQGDDGIIKSSVLMSSASGAENGDADGMRLIDMLQGYLKSGDFRFAAAVAERLLGKASTDAPIDPMVGMLAGLALRRVGRLGAPEGLARRLVDAHPGLPDGHALLGLALMLGGNREEARGAFRDALRRGLPMLAPVLHATEDAVEALGIAADEAPRIPLLVQAADSLLPGSLWSARRPVAASRQASRPSLIG